MSADSRRQIAEEAARLLAEQRHLSIDQARRKAAARVGCHDRRQFPDNGEIEQALKAYQAIFSQDQPAALLQLREVAKQAMESLAIFQPRLTGPVLSGTADDNSCITLLLYAETPEEVIFRLMELKIPWREEALALNYPDGTTKRRPLLSFIAGRNEVELLILDTGERRNPPLDPANGLVLKGADLRHLDRLISFES